MFEPLFLKPVFQEKIWGGDRLHTTFGFDLPSDKIGESWSISAHPHGVSVVGNGPYKGIKLDELWRTNKKLFGDPTETVFPLLVKILNAEDDLSVQVHPDDAYGLEHQGELGKTECWYIIDAKPDAEIIYGHNAESREELAEMIKEGRWEDLLRRVPVKKGDFFYVPSGTIHAIGAGILILETQQSSDTTYRVYDYDRVDDSGNKRDLHIQAAIDVTTVPAREPELRIEEIKKGSSTIVSYLQTPFFNVNKWQVDGEICVKKNAPYTLMTVIEGYGKLVIDKNEYDLKKGVSCIIPDGIAQWQLLGELSIIASEPGMQK